MPVNDTGQKVADTEDLKSNPPESESDESPEPSPSEPEA